MPKMMKKEDQFTVDFSDLKACQKIMQKYGNSDQPFGGTNAEGETVLINVSCNVIAVRTYQKNGWVRVNILYSDGTTEELYER